MAYPVIDLNATGENIRRIFEERRVSVAEISSFLGVNRSSVYKVLRGEAIFSLDNLFAVSSYLNLPMNDLIVAE